jgi:hypothetical protein
MVLARCPYCGEANDVGLLQKVRPGEATPMMQVCPHFVFSGATKYLGAEYVEQEFGVNFGTVPGSYSLEADIIKILNGHFKFVGPVAFAPDEKARDAARREVADFLRARKILK